MKTNSAFLRHEIPRKIARESDLAPSPVFFGRGGRCVTVLYALETSRYEFLPHLARQPAPPFLYDPEPHDSRLDLVRVFSKLLVRKFSRTCVEK
jgi:hypothetical protein